MHPISLFVLLSCLLIGTTAVGQKIATLEVSLERSMNGVSTPARIALDGLTFLPDSALTLFEIQNGKRIPVPIQLDNTSGRILNWMVSPVEPKSKKRVY